MFAEALETWEESVYIGSLAVDQLERRMPLSLELDDGHSRPLATLDCDTIQRNRFQDYSLLRERSAGGTKRCVASDFGEPIGTAGLGWGSCS